MYDRGVQSFGDGSRFAGALGFPAHEFQRGGRSRGHSLTQKVVRVVSCVGRYMCGFSFACCVFLLYSPGDVCIGRLAATR